MLSRRLTPAARRAIRRAKRRGKWFRSPWVKFTRKHNYDWPRNMWVFSPYSAHDSYSEAIKASILMPLPYW